MLAGVKDFCCMMPAMAAAGPERAAEAAGLDGCSGSTSLSEVWGDNAAGGDFCSALPVISI